MDRMISLPQMCMRIDKKQQKCGLQNVKIENESRSQETSWRSQPHYQKLRQPNPVVTAWVTPVRHPQDHRWACEHVFEHLVHLLLGCIMLAMLLAHLQRQLRETAMSCHLGYLPSIFIFRGFSSVPQFLPFVERIILSPYTPVGSAYV
jgi:hypothetical protein